MKDMKKHFRRILSMVCVLAMLWQVFIGETGLLVFANDTTMSPLQQTIQEAAYTSTYAGAETADMALATAKEQVQKVITEAGDSGASLTINAGTLAINAKGGIYTFTATVTPSGGTAFTTDTLTMDVKARPEPVKVVYNNPTTVNAATIDSSVITKGFHPATDETDKSYMTLTANTSIALEHTLEEAINLEAYPYVKISYRHEREQEGDVWETAQFFTWSDAYTGYTLTNEFYPHEMSKNTDTQWKDIIFDMADGNYTIYKEDGTTKTGSLSFYQGGWSGNAKKFRFDLSCTISSHTWARELDYEYIAFFGSKAEAEAYPIEIGNLKSVLENTKLSASYSEATDVTSATNLAREQVQAAVNTFNTANGTHASFVINEDGVLERYASGGTFTFTATVTLDDASTFDVELTMEIEPRPAPIVVAFNSPEMVNSASIGGSHSVKKEFVPDGVDGKQYMKLPVGGDSTTVSLQYTYYPSEPIDLDAYPYMKISYRHERDANATNVWETAQFYVNGSYFGYYTPFDNSTNTDTGWKQAIYNPKVGKYTLYDANGVSLGQRSIFENNTSLWTGEANMLRFYLTQGGTFAREFDLEYIAFFATEAEAIAYPGVPETDKVEESIKALKNATFSCESDVALTESDAKSEFSRQIAKAIQDAGITDVSYTFENEEYGPTSTEFAGSYKADVVFTTGDRITITLTIAKKPILPVIWTFDNKNILTQFKMGNGTAIYENGYAKLVAANPADWDGFKLEGSLKDDEKFDLKNLPFVKIKYKINSETKNQTTQIYCWLKDKGHTYAEFYGNKLVQNDGDMLTMIADMSVANTSDTAVWLENQTQQTTDQINFTYRNEGTPPTEGEVTSVRFNFGTQSGLPREAEVEYIGFFPTKEAAEAYEGAAAERVAQAKAHLQNASLEMRWGAGNTQEKALEGAMDAIDASCLIGYSDITLDEYHESTKEEAGFITCNVKIQSADVSEVVPVTIKIGKKPSEPIVWRFNDIDFLDDLSYGQVKWSMENNALKMVSTSPNADDFFSVQVNTPANTEQFYLEDYGYIRLKYKREGLAPAQIYFNTDAQNGNLGSVGLGTKEGHWYTTIIDTSIHDFENVAAYHYDLTDGNEEQFIRYSAYGREWSGEWRGSLNYIRFNFGRRPYLDRTLNLEYIAFFPTLADAMAYDDLEVNERLKANAQVALKGYTGSSVDYYAGNTEEAAKGTAHDAIADLLTEIAYDPVTGKNVGDVRVVIDTVSHKAPVMNKTDGSYTFTASIYNGETLLYTTEKYTLTIGKAVDTTPVVFTFSNPEFIKRVTGTLPTAMDYACMSLTDTNGLVTIFSLSLNGSEKFHLTGHPYIALKVNAEAATSDIILNGESYSLSNAIQGETLLVIDTAEGIVYDKTGTTQLATFAKSVPGEKINSLGMRFDDANVTVEYIGFFATMQEAIDYTGTTKVITDAIAAIQEKQLDCAYSDAKTQEDALSIATEALRAAIDENVELVSAISTDYSAPSTTAPGYIEVQATVGAGSQHDSHYGVATITITIGKVPSGPIVWDFTQDLISKLSKGDPNITLSKHETDDILIMDGRNFNGNDGFYFTLSDSKAVDFYLQDYPYVKLKYKYNNTSNPAVQFYGFINNATNVYREFNVGSTTYNDVWQSVLLDMTTDSLTRCNLDESARIGTAAITGTNDFRNKNTSFRLNMGRPATSGCYVELDYIAFFSSREEAEAYNGDYYYDAYDFNGKEFAQATQPLSEAPKTIETGIFVSDTTNTAMTILSNQAEGISNGYALETTAEGGVKFIYAGQEVLAATDVNVYDSKWHQIAVTLEDNIAILYIDGEEVIRNEASTINGDISLVAPTIANEASGLKPFIGKIYYVRLYDAVLTASQLSTNTFNQNVTANVLAGWFTGSQTDEGGFADVCGTNPMFLTDNYGKNGHEFLGNDYVITEKSLAETPVTYEFWMKAPTSTATGTYTILSNQTKAGDSYTAIRLTGGQLQMMYNGNEVFTTSNRSFADNIWRHVAITLGESTQLYIDGDLVATYTAVTSADSAKLPYYIGEGLASADDEYVGKLSDVRIWNSVKNEEAIEANMKEYPEKGTEGLLASWRLDMQTHLKYTDYSSNNNTGTLYSSGWYKLENIVHDYTLGAIGDTQSYVGSAGPNPDAWMETFENLSEKIDDLHMKYFFHLGDVTQNDTLVEWGYARKAFDYLEGKVPYSIILGNHDYPSPSSGTGAEFRDATNFNKAFPMSNFQNQTLSTFGGVYKENDVSNMYMFFEVDDIEYIVFSLEYAPRDGVLEWAGKICDRYPEKTAIILTHGYLAYGDDKSGFYDEWGDLWKYEDLIGGSGAEFDDGNGAQAVWDQLLSKHSNIALLLCGHSQNPFIVYRDKTTTYDDNTGLGDYGNNVIQMMVDHSAVVTPFPSTEGVMTLLAIDKETGSMHTYWYSPLYDAYWQTDNVVEFDMSDTLVKKDREAYFEPYESEEFSTFRTEGAYTYPKAKEFGYVFAGWYEEDQKTPIASTKTEGKAWAKFVDADVLSVKFQAGLTEKDGKYVIPDDMAKIRFVTTVDSLSYTDVAFMISIERTDGTYSTPKSSSSEEYRGKVYQSLYYVGDTSGKVMDYSPKVFSQYSNYFKTYTLWDIPSDRYHSNIKVTPYWDTLDGTRVYGKERAVCVNDIIKGYAEAE